MSTGVYIGRFQPFHNGHKEIVDKMLADGNEWNYIIFGGSESPRDRENPFSVRERKILVDRSIPRDVGRNLLFAQVANHPDDSIWAENIRDAIGCLTGETFALYGAHSDASSFYLDMFPEWEKRLTILDGTYRVHATNIRQWLRNRDWFHIEQHVPPGTFSYLKELVETEPDTCHKWLKE